MTSLKTKENINIALYILAIILMIINQSNKDADTQNEIIEKSSWLALMIASLYTIYLSRVKRKEESGKDQA